MLLMSICVAFDSLSHSPLWLLLLLTKRGILDKTVTPIKALYDKSVFILAEFRSSCFKIQSGICQGCVIAPDSFATCKDRLLERSTGMDMNGMPYAQNSFIDLDFADDACLLGGLLEFSLPVLTVFAAKDATLRVKVNRQKTQVQLMGGDQHMPSSMTVHGQIVRVTEEFAISVLSCSLHFKAVQTFCATMPLIVSPCGVKTRQDKLSSEVMCFAFKFETAPHHLLHTSNITTLFGM